MKKILLVFISLFAIITFSSTASAVENSDELSNSEYDTYIEERQLSKEIINEYGKYIVINEEEVKIDYDLVNQNQVDENILAQIEENVVLVNEYAKMDEASISKNGSIDFDIDEEYETQWKLYDFKISWSGIKFKFDKDASILLGSIGLLTNLALSDMILSHHLGHFINYVTKMQ